jgi:hypothetical protein
LLNKRGISVSSEAIEADPRKWAIKASESMGVVVLLKGSQTVVANGKDLIELPQYYNDEQLKWIGAFFDAHPWIEKMMVVFDD